MLLLLPATTDADPATLTLRVSDDQKAWHPIDFDGEFPRTFNEVFASIARDRQLVQVQTL
ncbi:hypothetical protein JK364_24335 [Streptomyces sp. 110]|uniref:Uncharacterized protein n=1 Tax=Streptomyces endocoffeicus TaxID=2898945 RepID=A0ABS1PSU2_9ACTN|nr:hypothetical protein [Streptomyces endocoffeicus]MBL1115503.1 hypothetical protein [Streptomyces endocoffeicus]